MEKLTSKKLMRLWRDFWTRNDHKEIKGASLIPEDNTVLFITAGMQPLIPYLMGKTHPMGNKLFDIQPCLRTNDIDDVGDNRHHTMFFMLGNWSLGAYFKEDAIKWSYEFLTSPQYLNIPKEKLGVTVFAGDETSPRDETASMLWQKQGLKKSQIYYFSKKENWWEMGGGVGPCGPDTEIYYDTGKPACGPNCDPSCDCGKWVEIWNNVFMEFNVANKGDKPVKLPKQNVDTGMGLERVVSILNGFDSTYQNDCFKGAIDVLEKASGKKFDFTQDSGRDFCIICDHIRASVFLLGDVQPTTPSNVGQGYVLRRLIRRALNCTRKLGMNANVLVDVAKSFIDFYGDEFARFVETKQFILDELQKEIHKFADALQVGLKEFNRIIANTQGTLDGASAFRLFDTFGFPIELTIDLAKEHNIKVDKQGYDEAMKKHQQLSRENSGAMFKGGVAVANNSEEATRLARLHTATHLMLGALRKVVGDYVEQRGSNITPERLRFDFLCDHKLTPEELNEVERLVNEAIAANVNVVCETMTVDQAKKSGAIGIFDNKYGDQITVYTMGKFSKEICGGPHAKTTGELGKFKILKEESSSSGVRRIKATIVDK